MLLSWLWLALHPDLTAIEKRTLAEAFPSVEMLLSQPPEAVSPEDDSVLPILRKLRNKDLTEANRVLELCRTKDIHLLPYNSPAYPSRLRQLSDAPVVLYYRGVLPDLNRCPVIGVVGTRRSTPYGMKCAQLLSVQLSACGALVISGGAAGIDTAAMESALDAGFPVVGVLGCGVDVVYPKSNAALFERLLTTGCLISEYPPETAPLRWRFPQRNRIISGISNGVLVVEAPEKSGALITARMAFAQGRDVFVVPGNIDSPACAGSNALLAEQALAVTGGWDIVKEYEFLYPGIVQKRALPPTAAPAQPSGASASPSSLPAKEQEKPKKQKTPLDKPVQDPYPVVREKLAGLSGDLQTVAQALEPEPCSVDQLVAATGLPANKVLAALTMLSIKGIALQHPGNRVSLKIQ